MIEPQQNEGNGRKLEGIAPWRVAVLPLVEFVFNKHGCKNGKVDQNQAPDDNKSGLVDEAPWRVAYTEKDWLYTSCQYDPRRYTQRMALQRTWSWITPFGCGRSRPNRELRSVALPPVDMLISQRELVVGGSKSGDVEEQASEERQPLLMKDDGSEEKTTITKATKEWNAFLGCQSHWHCLLLP